jgi:hypothetical protein
VVAGQTVVRRRALSYTGDEGSRPTARCTSGGGGAEAARSGSSKVDVARSDSGKMEAACLWTRRSTGQPDLAASALDAEGEGRWKELMRSWRRSWPALLGEPDRLDGVGGGSQAGQARFGRHYPGSRRRRPAEMELGEASGSVGRRS